MSREKQIKEMMGIICVGYRGSPYEGGPCEFGAPSCDFSCEWLDIAEALYNAGYRKQNEGEWEQQLRPYEDEIKCTACGEIFNIIDNCTEKFNYCPNCGAKMKGGAE